MTTSIDVQFPDDVALGPVRPVRVSDSNLEFMVDGSYADRGLHLHYDLAYKRDAVPAHELAAYTRTLREIRANVAYRFPVSNGVELARQGALKSRQLQDGTLDRDMVAEVVATLDRESEGVLQSVSEQISSGRPQGRELAEALTSRAIAYSNLERLQEALADLASALRADPALASGYLTRGEVYTKLGRFDEALADFEQVRVLEPEAPGLYRSRGHTEFLRGDYRAALAYFQRVAERRSGADQLHAVIWVYLAAAHLGQDARAIIAALPARADLSRWPGAAVMLMLGEATPEEMLAGAWSFERRTEVLNLCEAYFFLGHYRLLAGDREGARRAFQDAVATGIKDYLEYAYAKIEESD